MSRSSQQIGRRALNATKRGMSDLSSPNNLVNLFQTNSETVEQLRDDMEGLLAEVSELSRRNDELIGAKDADNATIRDLDNQLKEYKRKYELAKTELRSVKGRYHYCCPSLVDVMCSYSYFPTFPSSAEID